jgi:hypothetical protein
MRIASVRRNHVLYLALLSIVSCNRGTSPATASQRAAATRSKAETAASCTPVGAHAAHQGGFFNCQICHPCGGALAIATTQLSDGFAVSGTVTKDVSGNASCTVTCHGSQTVSWTSTSLGCSNCHGQWQGGAGGAISSHGIDPTQGLTANAPVCTRCHNTADHFDPSMAVVNADTGASVLTSSATPAQITVFCTSCHDGLGKTIGGETPPLLLGYATTTSGDFHGARAGTGFGGSLAAGFQVGQGPLDCTYCHEPHASGNAFLFAPVVNNTSIAGGAITRAGMGAEALCSACHLGDSHAGCKVSGCHDGKTTLMMDGVARFVDPAQANATSKPCFLCHGHEGIQNFSMPTWDNHPYASGDYCSHCHTDWFPQLVTTAPAIRNLTVTNITTNSAAIVWDTNVPTTTFVARGTTDLATMEGSTDLVTHHVWPLSGLAQGTTYTYRVRSSDMFRNFAEAPAQPASFTTASPGPNGFEPAPNSLVAYIDPGFLNLVAVAQPDTSGAVTLKWGAVTSGSGPTKYRVVVSTSATFSTTLYGPVDVTTTATTFTLGGLQPYPGMNYYWRVMAIDTVSGAQSAWSQASFQAYTYDPWG